MVSEGQSSAAHTGRIGRIWLRTPFGLIAANLAEQPIHCKTFTGYLRSCGTNGTTCSQSTWGAQTGRLSASCATCETVGPIKSRLVRTTRTGPLTALTV